MCLSYLKYDGKVPSYYKKRNIGYKIYRNSKEGEDVVCSKFRNIDGSQTGMFNRGAIKVGDGTIHCCIPGCIAADNDFETYESGFHIYGNLRDADLNCWTGNCIVEVEYSEPIHIGVNDSFVDKGNTIIARKIKLIKILKRK